MMTMKEACAITLANRRTRFAEHRKNVTQGNAIHGFTEKEWGRVVTSMKKCYGAKAKKHSHNALWRHYDQKIEVYH